MLRISVLHFNGAPPSAPITHDFDERGGTIGRDDSNTLALPDPDRHISRMQAQIQFDGMRYILIDHGGNPTSINGRPLGKGSQATLRDGDELGVGDYTLRVTITRDVTGFGGDTLPNIGAGTDPLGLFGSAPSATPSLQPPPLFAPAAPPAAAHSDDPFAVFAGTGAASPPQAPSTSPATDDPFSAFAVPRHIPRPVAPTALDPLGIGDLARPAEASSLDALFGLSGSALTQDPFFGSPLGDPAHAPQPAVSSPMDPLALFGASTSPAAAGDVLRHDSPLLNDAFTPPLARAETSSATTPANRLSVPQAPQGGVVSWSNTGAVLPQPVSAMPAVGASDIATPDPSREAPTLIVSAKATAAEPNQQPVPPSPAAAIPSTTVTATPSDIGADALLAAFVRGIGLPALKPPGGLTPALMEQVGMILREAVQGTVELLIARAATKREVRADVTMIVSKNNNPLKFSPDVDFALTQLLLPQGKGFMGPNEAMRDAYDDLRAHQIGFMAGMRAALASVLARFTPEELEARLTSRSLLDSVLPANRKARLWDLYEQRYQDISREAEDDFHTLFGREFLKAYEAQIAQLQDTQQ